METRRGRNRPTLARANRRGDDIETARDKDSFSILSAYVWGLVLGCLQNNIKSMVNHLIGDGVFSFFFFFLLGVGFCKRDVGNIPYLEGKGEKGSKLKIGTKPNERESQSARLISTRRVTDLLDKIIYRGSAA